MNGLGSQNGPGSPPSGGRAGSWAARFGRVILEHGVATIPSALFHYQGRLQLKAQEVWFICYILARKWKAGLPHPSLKQIEVQTGVTQRQLHYVRGSLVDLGYLHVHAQYGANGGQGANCYDFTPLFAALEALLAADAPPDNPILGDDPPPEEGAGADSSFAARYGRVIARAGIATVPLALFTYQRALDLAPEQVWFTAYILAHKWTGDLPYPSIKRMVARTGYSERHLHTLKNSLVAAGYLRLQHRYDSSGAQDSNAYDFGALLERITALVQQDAAPLTLVPAETGGRPVGGQRRSRAARVVAVSPLAAGPGPGGEFLLPPAPGAADAAPPRAPARPSAPVAGDGHPPARAPEAPEGGPGSSPPTREAPESPYLSRLLQDLSEELGDRAHARSNITQAHRLWYRLQAATGMTDTTFGDEFIQAARKRTRKAQGAQGHGQINNKMAYFFRVLRELVDLHLADPAAGTPGMVAYG